MESCRNGIECEYFQTKKCRWYHNPNDRKMIKEAKEARSKVSKENCTPRELEILSGLIKKCTAGSTCMYLPHCWHAHPSIHRNIIAPPSASREVLILERAKTLMDREPCDCDECKMHTDTHNTCLYRKLGKKCPYLPKCSYEGHCAKEKHM